MRECTVVHKAQCRLIGIMIGRISYGHICSIVKGRKASQVSAIR